MGSELVDMGNHGWWTWVTRGVDLGNDTNNAADSDVMTRLVRAAANGHRGTVALLVDKGADVNVANNFDGRTPMLKAALRAAATGEHTETVALLVTRVPTSMQPTIVF